MVELHRLWSLGGTSFWHLKLDQFFFFDSYPYSHGVSVCPPVCWQPATLKLPYTLRYLRVGNSHYLKL